MHPKLIESIRLEDGTLHLCTLHEARMKRSLSALCPDSPLLKALERDGLVGLLTPHLPHVLPRELTKVRLVYSCADLLEIRLEPYTPRTIRHLRLLEIDESLDYAHKYLDRSVLPRPRDLQDDEEVLYVRSGLLTDTSYTNIVLRFGDSLLTPRRPLLAGIMREHLLEVGLLDKADLDTNALAQASTIYLINAMMPLEDAIECTKGQYRFISTSSSIK